MKLEQLDKNSKYGYRRLGWNSAPDYIVFDGTSNSWEFVSHITGEKSNTPLSDCNAKADDWYLSDIPNKFYKRVAIVTKDVFGHPAGSRIIQTDTDNNWILADYSDTSRVRSHTLDANCKWEDEMEPSETISCSSEPTTQKENTMNLKNFLDPYINVWILIIAFSIAELITPTIQFLPAIAALLTIKVYHFIIDLFTHLLGRENAS